MDSYRKSGSATTLVSSGTDSPSKSGRHAATALGRVNKHSTHHDHENHSQKPKVHVDRQSSTENVRLPTSEKVLQRLKDDREKAILHESLKRTKAPGDLGPPRHDNRESRERDILNQSLKRTKVLQDSKPRLKDDRERDILNQSLKRAKVTGGDDLQRLRDDRRASESTPPRPKGGEDSKVKPKPESVKNGDWNVRQRPESVKNGDSSVRHERPRSESVKNGDSSVRHERPRSESVKNGDSSVRHEKPRPESVKNGDSSVRHEKPRPESVKNGDSNVRKRPESVKKTTPMRPQHESKGHVVKKETSTESPQVKKDRDHQAPKTPSRKEEVKDQASTKAPSSARKEEDVKKDRDHGTPKTPSRKEENVRSEKKRPMGVSDAKEVRVRSITKIEPVSKNGSNAPVRSVTKTVAGSVTKAKQEKTTKKVFSLPGQRFEPPEERDALRLFYGSLHQQIPTSDMANIWLMEHGLLEADEAQRVLTQKVKSKTGVAFKSSTPAKFSNGKSSNLKHKDFHEIKPVSKKLKL